MRILATVIRGQLPCLRKDNVIVFKLLDVKPVSKLMYQVYTRDQTTTCLQGIVFKQKPIVSILQQKRSVFSETPGVKIFTPLYSKDHVPRDYEIIYQSEIGDKQARLFVLIGVVIISYLFLFMYLLLQFNGEWKFNNKTIIPVVNIEIPTLTLQLICTMVACLMMLAYVSLPYLKLPVKRIYEGPCKEKYIGILKKGAFRTERVEFEMCDVISTGATGRKVLKKGNASIRGRGCLLFAMDFKVPKYFNEIIGDGPVKRE